MAPASELKYYPAFDYLRIFLALAVAAGHAGVHGWDQSGNFAVQVFFAMSGWLIGSILLNSSAKDLPRFYFNRVARIWVPYFLTILLLMIVSLMKEPVTRKWIEIFFYDLTFTYDFFGPPQLAAFVTQMPLDGTGNHLWSICAEEQFYLISPLLLVLLGRAFGRSIWLWAAIAIGVLASPFSLLFGAISLGVLAAISRQYWGDWQTVRLARVILLLLAIASFALTAGNWGPYEILAPWAAIFIVLVCAQYGKARPVGLWLGGISYPLYLNHWIGIFLANALLGRVGLRGTMAATATAIIFAFGVAALLYILVDRRVMASRHRYFTEQRGRLLATLGFALIVVGFVGAYFYGQL